MDDFTYDIVCKKRIANGAKHMKRGSKSKRCSLPSDHLTAKQLKERNGPIMSYALNVPMSWETFKSMPLDLQQKYLDNLHSRFGVGAANIGRDLFGLSDAYLTIYANRKGLRAARGARMGDEAKERWENWLHEKDVSPVTELPPAEEAVEKSPEITEEPIEKSDGPQPIEAPASVDEKADPAPAFFYPGALSGHELFEYIRNYGRRAPEPAKPLGLSNMSATFNGIFDAEKFLNWITKLPMPEGDVRISVEVCSR